MHSVEGDQKKLLTKAKLIGRIYRHLGVSAVNVGYSDLLKGVDFLQDQAADGLPLISANLLDAANSKTVFPPFLIKEISGLRVAFFGLLTPQLGPVVQKSVGNKVVVGDPLESARKTVAVLKEKADLVVLLSGLGLKKDREMAKALSGVPFILGGRDGRYIRWADHEGESYIVQSYKKGMYLGLLELSIEKVGLPFQDTGRRDRMEQEIGAVERRLKALKHAQEKNPSQTLTRSIEKATKKKEGLESQLASLEEAQPGGNRFGWRLERMNNSVPVDEKIQEWIREAGIVQD